jgi:hypothetical protein
MNVSSRRRGEGHRRLASLTCALVLLVTAVASPSVASAAINCQDAQWTNRFDGFSTFTSYESKVVLEDRTISLCSNVDGATSAASAWAMLAGGANSGLEYAQIGYAKIAGMAQTKTFTEYNDGEGQEPNWHREFWPGIFANGTNHTYRVVYDFSTGKISMIVDGSTKAITPWSPDNEWTVGWHSEFFGETVDRGDDMPGSAANPARFTGPWIRKCRGCQLTHPGPNDLDLVGVIPPIAAYKFQWIVGTGESTFDIWTER